MANKRKIDLKKNRWIIALIIVVIAIGAYFIFSSKEGGLASLGKTLPNLPVSSESDINLLKSKINKSLSFDAVNANPDAYKGEVVEWGGMVFSDPERDDSGVYLQMYYGDSVDKAFVVGYKKPDFQVKSDDFLKVLGVVKGSFEGENAFGAKLKRTLIEAGYIEKSTRSAVASPAEMIAQVNKDNSQNGFTVTLEKVEIASDETRVFVRLKNDSSQKINFYTFDVKLTQGSKQFEHKILLNNSEDLPSEILPGIEAKGVIVFDAVDKNSKNLKVFLGKPTGEDWSQKWEDITFEITLP